MRLFNFLLIFILPIIGFSQSENDKIFYLDSLKLSTKSQNYFYKKVIKDFNVEKEKYEILIYNKSEVIVENGFTLDKNIEKYQGEVNYFYGNGILMATENYENGTKSGKEIQYYEDGFKKLEGENSIEEDENKQSLKIINFWDENQIQKVSNGNGVYRTLTKSYDATGPIKDGYFNGNWTGKQFEEEITFSENYNSGVLIEGVSTTKTGEKISYNQIFEKPQPKNGIADFYKFVGKNYRIPTQVYKDNIKGKILLQFVVNKKGNITEIEVKKSLSAAADNEAIRVLKKYSSWNPGKWRGIIVRVSYKLPITLSYD